jgi:hypothetical protein
MPTQTYQYIWPTEEYEIQAHTYTSNTAGFHLATCIWLKPVNRPKISIGSAIEIIKLVIAWDQNSIGL